MTPLEACTVDNYGIISTRFNASRYKVWDGVKNFLDSLNPNCKVLEIGCGNGKNMLYRNDLQFLGIDPCDKFIEICKTRGLNVNFGIATAIEIDDDMYDASLSVAVIHHLSTHSRRLHAINEMVRITKPGGKIFIEVWSVNDPKYIRYSQNNNQDTNIPFTDNNNQQVMRFYHFFTKDEFSELITAAKYANKILVGDCIEEKNNLIFNGTVCEIAMQKNN
jgi:tRNA (uracil-5-)-methyltransferase TRM9